MIKPRVTSLFPSYSECVLKTGRYREVPIAIRSVQIYPVDKHGTGRDSTTIGAVALSPHARSKIAATRACSLTLRVFLVARSFMS